jgi:hypothetical protein
LNLETKRACGKIYVCFSHFQITALIIPSLRSAAANYGIATFNNNAAQSKQVTKTSTKDSSSKLTIPAMLERPSPVYPGTNGAALSNLISSQGGKCSVFFLLVLLYLFNLVQALSLPLIHTAAATPRYWLL